MDCPFCSSSRVVSVRSGVYKCQSCGKEFDSSNSQEKMSSATSAYLRATRLNKPAASNTSKNAFDPNELSPEDIYDIGIRGTALIYCNDLGCSGSGFLIRQDGLVITNAHVIYNEEDESVSQDIYVTINGIETTAQVVCYGDPDGSDVALLQLASTSPKQHILKTTNSDLVRVGSRVYAIGNSLGEGLCITTGIISDKDREVFNERCFMSDVATNGGNSGGPLLNTRGEVIAICVAGNPEAKGMNYFIPINYVLELLSEYLQ